MPCLEAPSNLSESSADDDSLASQGFELQQNQEPQQQQQQQQPPPDEINDLEIEINNYRFQRLGAQSPPLPQSPPRPLPLSLPAPINRRMRLVHGQLLRISSYDRDVPLLEEENHWPTPAVHLLPVSVRPQMIEPNLTEFLVSTKTTECKSFVQFVHLHQIVQYRVTQRQDLENVETLRLRVISFSISLSRLALFLPRLQQLDLSGSILNSLRDLGCGFMHLTYLNVSNCGLFSFDGISGLPAVRHLAADGNMIQRVSPLGDLPALERLSCKQNRISDLGLLSFLGLCGNLLELDLMGNPVCHLPLYRITLQRSVPSLQLLDGIPIREGNSSGGRGGGYGDSNQPSTSNSDDGDLSSLSSEIFSRSESLSETSTSDCHGDQEFKNK